MERVCSEFFPHEARTILGIPLSSRQSTNTLIWAGTKLGHYSTKSAYKLLSEAPSSGTSNPSAHNSFWRNIWSLAVPNKIKHFIWPACWDRCLQKRTYSQGRSPETALVTFARRKWRHHPCVTGLSETILWIGLWIFEIYGLGLQVQRTPVGREICFRGLEYLANQKRFKIPETMPTIFKHLPRLPGTVSGISRSSTSTTTRDTNGFGPQTTDNN